MKMDRFIKLAKRVFKKDLSFGYIGNLGRWGDDRGWYVWHPNGSKFYIGATERAANFGCFDRRILWHFLRKQEQP